MADLAKQLRQLQDAQRLRELAQQYGYSQQDINTLKQAVPQALPQLSGQGMLPPAQMPQYVPPTGQLPPAPMRDYALRPKEFGALPPAQMPSIPSSQGMTPAEMEMLRRATPGYQAPAPSFKDILFNPGQVMQQNYVDPAIIEQMYYRGLLSR